MWGLGETPRRASLPCRYRRQRPLGRNQSQPQPSVPNLRPQGLATNKALTLPPWPWGTGGEGGHTMTRPTEPAGLPAACPRPNPGPGRCSPRGSLRLHSRLFINKHLKPGPFWSQGQERPSTGAPSPSGPVSVLPTAFYFLSQVLCPIAKLPPSTSLPTGGWGVPP